MRYGFTVNIGNYENLKIESSDNDDMIKCFKECLELIEINMLEHKGTNKARRIWYNRLKNLIKLHDDKILYMDTNSIIFIDKFKKFSLKTYHDYDNKILGFGTEYEILF